MDQFEMSNSTSAWDFFVKAAFVIAIGATLMGIYLLPGELVVKGYFLISTLFHGVFHHHHVQDDSRQARG